MRQTGLGKPRYMEACDWDQCRMCGECLTKCNQMDLTQEEAKEEKRRLIMGEEPKHVFENCTLCMTCNSFCSEGLKPFELILQRVAEKNDSRQKKLPALLNYLLVGTKGPGFFKDLHNSLNIYETDIVNRWKKVPGKAKEVIYPGCFGRLFCKDINNSTVLKDIPVYSPDDVCCGEWHYRAGLWDLYEEMADKYVEHFSKLNCERMICLCSSCYSFIGHILPEVYGKVTGKKTLPFEVISFNDWLWEKVEKGELSVKNPINYKGAIHDSCHARRMGPHFQETLRKLYKTAGADIVELEHNTSNGICCGAASMPVDYRSLPLALNYVKGMTKRLGEVKKSNTNELITHCEGCILPMTLMNRFYGIKLHYHREELLRAFGDEITKPITKVMPVILKSIAKKSHLAFRSIKTQEFPHVE